VPIGARRGEAWVVIPEGPFVVESGGCSFFGHDDIAIDWLQTVVVVDDNTMLQGK